MALGGARGQAPPRWLRPDGSRWGGGGQHCCGGDDRRVDLSRPGHRAGCGRCRWCWPGCGWLGLGRLWMRLRFMMACLAAGIAAGRWRRRISWPCGPGMRAGLGLAVTARSSGCPAGGGQPGSRRRRPGSVAVSAVWGPVGGRAPAWASRSHAVVRPGACPAATAHLLIVLSLEGGHVAAVPVQLFAARQAPWPARRLVAGATDPEPGWVLLAVEAQQDGARQQAGCGDGVPPGHAGRGRGRVQCCRGGAGCRRACGLAGQ